MLAQEEFAKAFVLYLVREDILPWCRETLRITKSHECKHLVAIVMDYLDPQWSSLEELQKIYDDEYALDGAFPKHVSSALNILYFDKMLRSMLDAPEYDLDVRKVARGKRDEAKQDATYVGIGPDGRTTSTPLTVKLADSSKEYEKARQYRWFVSSLPDQTTDHSLQFRKLSEALKIVYWQDYSQQERR